MLRRIPAKLFDEWMAFYALDPWGEERADRRAAYLTTKVYNYLRPSEQLPYDFWDFMPYSDRPPPPTDDELVAKVDAL